MTDSIPSLQLPSSSPSPPPPLSSSPPPPPSLHYHHYHHRHLTIVWNRTVLRGLVLITLISASNYFLY
ncbi:unnamed protein product [Cercopithifilaria johnstoni]|uniref:Uncharacterized protein n=1 Tax=Cercopithifilaria johnstoni TaxID=2874296 RepID=A0A8J2M576_9BILA|nr:unnamed protein product [Cercopithifilaria johnstoni]